MTARKPTAKPTADTTGETPWNELPATRPEVSRQMTFNQIAEAFGGQVVDLAEVPALDSAFGEILNGPGKDRLVGVPFLIVDWSQNSGDKGRFVSLRVVTQDSAKYVVNDGSTGIMSQMDTLEESGVKGGVVCRHGLRRSDYTYTDPQGEEHPASTYYLDTRP